MISTPHHLGKRPVVFFVAVLAAFFIGFFFSEAATAPVITSGPAEGSTVATSSATFTFEAPDSVDIQCTFGAAAYGCASPQEFTGLGDSAYTFAVAAQDALGEWATTTRNFTVDTVTPLPIDASAGPNGSITPSGTVLVSPGSDQSFVITPDADYAITEVVVDGVSVGTTTNYTFTAATTSHTISASFFLLSPPAPEPEPPASAPASGGGGGGPPGLIGLVSDGSGGFSAPAASVPSSGIIIALTPPPFSPGVPSATTATTSSSVSELPRSDTFIFSQTLMQGSRGEDVKKLQERLMAIGLFDYPVATGYFGPVTLRAVKAFQLRNNLPQVGQVGPLTRNALNGMGVAAR